MLVELILLAIVVVVLRVFVFKSKADKLYEKIPGPKPYPLIGNALDFDYPKVEVTDTMKQISFKYGPVSLIWMVTDPVVMLRDPNDVEQVLGSSAIIDKAPIYKYLFPWLNQGLLTSGGDYWRRHRKILTPAFHFKVLEHFVPVFVRNARIFVAKLYGEAGKEYDVMKAVGLYSLDIISETAMGLEINAQNGESEYLKAVNELQEIVAHRSFDMLQSTPLFFLTSRGRRHNQLISYLHSVTENVIKDRKSKLLDNSEDNKTEVGADTDIGMKTKKAFLDLLLEYNKEGAGLTDAEIREEVDTFMFEGYDTTTSTIAFCLYSLSQHVDVQEKAYEEIMEIFGDSDRDSTYQDLQEMKYLDKVIKESLRRYPTIQFVGRRYNQNLELKSGYVVPKNTSIVVFIEAINHDPAIHTDPLKFDPDRFNVKSSSSYVFTPFSAGPRNCIGQKYAMLEIKALVSLILRKFRLLPSDVPITFWFNIVLKSKTGIYMSFEPRNLS